MPDEVPPRKPRSTASQAAKYRLVRRILYISCSATPFFIKNAKIVKVCYNTPW